jgi:uncharacterized membrane protein
MSTPASIRKHPIHPMIVPIPIGLWIFSLICDVVYRAGSANPVWDEMAFYSLLVGIGGALLAAIPGFVDFLSIADPRAKRVALTHLILNLIVVALYAVNAWMRTEGPAGLSTPFLLSIVAILLLSVSGWLGGELVYRHGVGIDRQSPTLGSGAPKIG